jgi:hypothetical protein
MIFTGKYDRVSTGVISALFLPVFILLLMWLFSSGHYTLRQYFAMIVGAGIATHIISLCVFPNVIIFMIFNRFDMLLASKGVLGTTIIWAIIVLLIRIL